MEWYKNILCISGDELIQSDKNPTGLIPFSTYRNWTNRKTIIVVRRGKYTQPALIDFNSLPQNIKEQVPNTLITPLQQANDKPFRDTIVIDEKAAEYYRDYVLENDKRLPVDKQHEYTVNASVLNAIKQVWADCSRARKSAGGSMKGFWKNASECVNRIT